MGAAGCVRLRPAAPQPLGPRASRPPASKRAGRPRSQRVKPVPPMPRPSRRAKPAPRSGRPRHGCDNGLLAVTDGLANLAHATCQRLVGYDNIRPDRLEQLLLGHQAIRILHEIAQQLEALRAKRKLAIRGSQRVPRDIQRISLELEHLRAAQLSRCQDELAMKLLGKFTCF